MEVQRAFLEFTDFDNMDSETFNSLASTELIKDSVTMNTTAFYEWVEDEDKVTGEKTTAEKGKGNVTEIGLRDYLRKHAGKEAIDTFFGRRKELLDDAKFGIKVPLNSERKRATIAFEKAGGEEMRIYCKGAPEMVLKFCTHYIGPNGHT